MQILYVCTANVCRSASAQRLLTSGLAAERAKAGAGSQVDRLLSPFVVASAGVFAINGMSWCPQAPALADQSDDERAKHVSRLLEPHLLPESGLILAASREHRDSIVRMNPHVRVRTFTIRQAGRIAAWMIGPGDVIAAGAARSEGLKRAAVPAISEDTWRLRYDSDDPRASVPAMPAASDPDARWAWFLGELDAGRPYAPAAAVETLADPADGTHLQADAHRRPFSRLRGWMGLSRDEPLAEPTAGRLGAPAPEDDPSHPHPDDLPDPHTDGMELHALVDSLLRESTDALLAALVAVAKA